VAIPDFQTIMRPMLAATQDGERHRVADVVDRLAVLLITTERGRFRITERGLEALRTGPPQLDMKHLSRFE
jgi:restriction endonuclease Mrr